MKVVCSCHNYWYSDVGYIGFYRCGHRRWWNFWRHRLRYLSDSGIPLYPPTTRSKGEVR